MSGALSRYAMAGRIGAHVRWGNTTDRAAATAPARQALADRFLREVQAEHPQLDHQTQVRMAESRKKAFYSRIARKSVAARKRGGAA